jgi:hypothetical protein
MLAPGVARADVTNFAGIDAPIVRINIRHGNVTIRTWNRSAVALDADPALLVQRRTTNETGVPGPVLIPRAEQSSDGVPAELPSESFVLNPFPAGPREALLIRSPPGDPGFPAAMTPATSVTITVPSDTLFVIAHTADGSIDLHDFRSGTFVGFVGRGRITLANDGGTAFAQTGRGPLVIEDSSFDRLRARSLYGNMTFVRCNVRQIEATSVAGSIVFDDGGFEPGLARFESARGDVAVGALGAVQLSAHTGGPGRVYTSFQPGTRLWGRDGEGAADVGDGGPVVTATSEEGNVFLYDGSLREHPEMPHAWQPPLEVLDHPAAGRHPAPPYARPPFEEPLWRRGFRPPPPPRRPPRF